MRSSGVALVVMISVAVAVGCGDGDEPASPPTTAAPTTTAAAPSASTETITARDDARDRELTIDLYFPATNDPAPTVVMAHGFGGSKDKFTDLARRWQDAGYVVILPNFPGTNDGVPGRSPADLVNQPADLSFALDTALDLFGDSIDPDRIAVAGLSLGGATAQATLFDTCCRDDRFRAGILMSTPLPPSFPGGTYAPEQHPVPTLVFVGTADLAIPPDKQRQNFEGLPTPTWLVTLEGGIHSAPYENEPSPHDDIVAAVTVAFLDAQLRGDAAAIDRMTAAAQVEGRSRIEART